MPSKALQSKPSGKAADSSTKLQDRYTVANNTASLGDIRNLDSVVSANISTSVGSTDSSTSSGTSYETEDSEALEADDLFDDEEFEDLEIQSMDTHPVMSGWVDSACSWMDRPMCILNFGKETSLLRQSKGRTRPSAIQQMRMSEALSTAANMKLSASERRILRLRRKGIHAEGPDDNDAVTNVTGDADTSEYTKTSSVDKKNNDVKLFIKKRIQPLKEHPEENTAPTLLAVRSNPAHPEQVKEGSPRNFSLTLAVEPVLSVKSNHSEYNDNEEAHEEDDSQETEEKTEPKKDPEGSVRSVRETFQEEPPNMDSGEHEEAESQREGRRNREDRELSVTLDKVLMDSPSSTAHGAVSISGTKSDGYLIVPSFELPESDSIESTNNKEEQTKTEKDINPSTRSERSAARKIRIMKVVQRSRSVPRRTEAEITDLTHIDGTPASPSQDVANASSSERKRNAIRDGAKDDIPNDVEIIDVLSLDDQDSWTPGIARDPRVYSHRNTKKKRQKESTENHQQHQARSRDPSPSLSRGFSNPQGRDPSPSRSGREVKSHNAYSTNANEVEQTAASLWDEEAAKLISKSSKKAATKSGSKYLPAVNGADDLWTQEEQKLQTPEADIFEDPMAREAFLGHRRGRLQDIGTENVHRSRSQSRRRRLVKALQGGEQSDQSSRSVRSTRSSKSSSLHLRGPPTPEAAVLPIKMIRSKSRESRGKSREPLSPASPKREVAVESTTEISGYNEDQHMVHLSAGVNKKKDLVAIRSIDDGQMLRTTRSRGRDESLDGSDSANNTKSKQPIKVNQYTEGSEGRGHARPVSRHYDRQELEPQNRPPRRRSKSREIETVDNANAGVMVDHQSSLQGRDSRDDRESQQISRSTRRGSTSSPPTEEWPDYDTVVSATRELRKLEKKIEKQLRQVKRETKNQEWDTQTVSSKEIRKLEKQLAQKLKQENEKRATKLKRIRRKVHKTSSSAEANAEPVKPTAIARPKASPTAQHQQDEPEQQFQPEKQQPHPMPEEANDPSSVPPSKNFSQKVDDFREKSKFDQMRVLRSSRYLRGSSPHGLRALATPIDDGF